MMKNYSHFSFIHLYFMFYKRNLQQLRIAQIMKKMIKHNLPGWVGWKPLLWVSFIIYQKNATYVYQSQSVE